MAAVMIQSVADNQIINFQNHVIPGYLIKYCLRDFYMWSFVFHKQKSRKQYNRYIQNVRDLQHHQIPADDPGQCGERDKFHWTSSSLSGHEYLDYIKSACRMQGKPS